MSDDIKVWAQMFFDDGSVTQGIRISADVYDDDRMVEEVSEKLLDSVNRTEGLLLIWGAGLIEAHDVTSSSEQESDSSES